MSRVKLPEGVPLSNDDAGFGDGASFSAPDMATPRFTSATSDETKTSQSSQVRTRLASDRFVEDDGNDAPPPKPSGSSAMPAFKLPGTMMLIVGLGALLAAVAVFAMSKTGQTQPLCSEQPAWNQYNCRAG